MRKEVAPTPEDANDQNRYTAEGDLILDQAVQDLYEALQAKGSAISSGIMFALNRLDELKPSERAKVAQELLADLEQALQKVTEAGK